MSIKEVSFPATLTYFSCWTFLRKSFESFWYSGSSQRFLIDLKKNEPGLYVNQKNFSITELMLDSADIDEAEAELLMFQSGYLTVKEVVSTIDERIYLLDIHNREVKNAFDLLL